MANQLHIEFNSPRAYAGRLRIRAFHDTAESNWVHVPATLRLADVPALIAYASDADATGQFEAIIEHARVCGLSARWNDRSFDLPSSLAYRQSKKTAEDLDQALPPAPSRPSARL